MNNPVKLILALLAVSPMLLGQATTGTEKKETTTVFLKDLEADDKKDFYSGLGASYNDFISDVIVLGYADPHVVVKIIKGLASGHEYAICQANKAGDIKAIAVRDFAQNVKNMKFYAYLLDVPAPKAKPISLQANLVFASNKPIDGDSVPEHLSQVVSSISKTFNYKYFVYGATFMQVINTNSDEANGSGAILFPNDKSNTSTFVWKLIDSQISSETDKLSANFSINFTNSAGIRLVRIQNAYVDLSENETTVIGTTTFNDVAVIVVLTNKSI
jgi:hypothetical protein